MRSAVWPLLLSTCLGLFIILYRVAELPTPAEIITFFAATVERNIWVVFLAALLEGVLVLNLYFPGSLVILIGIASSVGHPGRAAIVVALTTAAFVVTAMANYYLGVVGWHRVMVSLGLRETLQRNRQRLARYGWIFLVLSYVHPNIGAFTVTNCGILKYPARPVFLLSAGSITLWNCLWGIFFYRFLPDPKTVAGDIRYVVAALLGWAAVAFTISLIRCRRRHGATRDIEISTP